ncbi:MAG: hypothetical protein CM15mP74_28280 [Halieaceae bacterium]|nr:MAG: hypothetical protein CM15mP74_28280 [Halieaceae bacterium]
MTLGVALTQIAAEIMLDRSTVLLATNSIAAHSTHRANSLLVRNRID